MPCEPATKKDGHPCGPVTLVQVVVDHHSVVGLCKGDDTQGYKKKERACMLLAIVMSYFGIAAAWDIIGDIDVAMCQCVEGSGIVGDGSRISNECTTLNGTDGNVYALVGGAGSTLVHDVWIDQLVARDHFRDYKCGSAGSGTNGVCDFDTCDNLVLTCDNVDKIEGGGGRCGFNPSPLAGFRNTTCDRTVLCCMAYLNDLITDTTIPDYRKDDDDITTGDIFGMSENSEEYPARQYCRTMSSFLKSTVTAMVNYIFFKLMFGGACIQPMLEREDEKYNNVAYCLIGVQIVLGELSHQNRCESSRCRDPRTICQPRLIRCGSS